MAAVQLGSSEWRFSLLQQIYETFDVDGDCAPLLVVDSMLKQTHRWWQVRMSSSLRSCRRSARSERRSGDPPRMLSFWGLWRLRGTPRRAAAIQWPTLRALSVAAHSRTRDPNFTRVGPCPVQVSRDVFVRSYDRALPRKADDFAQIATKFLSAARNVREERLSLRRGLVQTTLPAVTHDVVSTRVRNWTAA